MTAYFIDDAGAMTTLQHYGVKGMKWGVRRDPDRQIAKLQKTIAKREAFTQRTKGGVSRQDIRLRKLAGAEMTIAGAAHRGDILSRQQGYKKKFDPLTGQKEWTRTKKTRDPSAKQLIGENRRATAKAYTETTAVGAAIAVGVAVGVPILGRKLGLTSPKAQQTLKTGALFLAGAQALHTTRYNFGIAASHKYSTELAKRKYYDEDNKRIRQEIRKLRKGA